MITLRKPPPALSAAVLVLLAAPAAAQLQIVAIPCAAGEAIYSGSGALADGSGENLLVGANSLLAPSFP